MCGLAGIVARQPIDGLPRLLDAFSTALAHRGPDDRGFLTWNGEKAGLGRDATALGSGSVGLVHRRLSIVDLSERGWQPMIDASGQYAILLNGEIYNHIELRHDLESSGIRFRSQADTEVLLQLLIRDGVEALSKTIGMFAFAFVDFARRRLWLARDPFGIKPLFYTATGDQLAFASEIGPLVDLGFAPRSIEPKALFDYLRHAITDHGELTLVSGVRQLLPAHAMEVNLDTAACTRPQRYWHPTLTTRFPVSLDVAGEQLRALLTDSVRLHLRADVPVAATLSGGIDSSAIVGLIGKTDKKGELGVFSYIADDPTIGEERYARAMASSVGVDLREIHTGPEELADHLDGLILAQGQPFATTSIWAQNRVFARVRGDGFKVVLDGQGADELFGGYPVFRAARLATLIRRARWGDVIGFLKGLPGSKAATLVQAVSTVFPLPAGVQVVARQLIGRPSMPRWLNGAWYARYNVAVARPFAEVSAPTDLTAQLYDATIATSLPMLLRYADRNAMAVSLENRVPFLTTALADFALSLPDELLIGPDGLTKRILRQAIRGLVPDTIVDRRDKIGFVTPEKRWFGESEALRTKLSAVLERSLPSCFASDFRSSLKAVAAGKAPYTAAVWRSWNVLRWAELMRLEFPA